MFACALAAAGTLFVASDSLAQNAEAQTTPTAGYTVTGARSYGEPPKHANLTVKQAGRIASAHEEVREQTDRYEALQFLTGFVEPGSWIVDFRPVSDGRVEDRVVAQ